MNDEVEDRIEHVMSLLAASARLRNLLAEDAMTAADTYEVQVIDGLLARYHARVEDLRQEALADRKRQEGGAG